MNQKTVVAIDAGRSAVKVAFKTPLNAGRFIYPSAAIPARTLSDEAEAARAKSDTVLINGMAYWVGETAMIQRGPVAGASLSDDWIESDEHSVLLLSALKRLDAYKAGVGDKLIVLGLPGRQFQQQKGRLENVAKKLFDYEVKVVPQPKAPFNRILQMEDGTLAKGRTLDESYAVIDVGRYTTDLAIIVQGRFIEAGLDSCSGTKGAAEKMLQLMSQKGLSVSLSDAERALATRSIRFRGEVVDLGREVKIALQSFQDEVMATVNRLIDPYSATLHGIILAGGGAPFIEEPLKRSWKTIITAPGEDSRYMVAEGMARWAAGILLARRNMAAYHAA